jgi:hypothetical protein
MAIQISGTSVINNSRQLQNIASLDSATTATIAAAGVGVGRTDFTSTGGSTSQTFSLPNAGKAYLITSQSVTCTGTTGGALQIRPANALYPTNYRNMGGQHNVYHTHKPYTGVYWSPSETQLIADDSKSIHYPNNGIHTSFAITFHCWIYGARYSTNSRTQFVADLNYIDSGYNSILCRSWGVTDFLGNCSGVKLQLVGGTTFHYTSTWSLYEF